MRWHSQRTPQRGSHQHGAASGDNGVIEPDTERATTLVIGDPIVWNVRLRGTLTVSFHGTTVADITEKIVAVLDSQHQVNRVVIQLGTNDTSRQQYELLKQDFTKLFKQNSQSRLCVFISSPTLPVAGALDS